MLLGDLTTAVQEKLPIRVVVFNNGSLNFEEPKRRSMGCLMLITGWKIPTLGRSRGH
jgi:pyruvate dehydrogenase (quinone)